MNVLLFGPPGAGKGTQSALLVEKLDYKHISSGDLFRENIKAQTELGMKAKTFMDQGQLVPDEITIGMIGETFKGLGGKPFILDGFPRTLAQAKALEGLLEQRGVELGKAIFLDVPKGELLGRLTGRRVCSQCSATYHVETKPTAVEGVCDSCGGEVVQRKDDSEDVISQRLEAYEESTAPLREYYESAGILAVVDGQGATQEIFKKVEGLVKSE